MRTYAYSLIHTVKLSIQALRHIMTHIIILTLGITDLFNKYLNLSNVNGTKVKLTMLISNVMILSYKSLCNALKYYNLTHIIEQVINYNNCCGLLINPLTKNIKLMLILLFNYYFSSHFKL